MMVICSNLFRILIAIDENDYATIIAMSVYTSAILVQIFLYCWFGNEVKLKARISLKVIPLVHQISRQRQLDNTHTHYNKLL